MKEVSKYAASAGKTYCMNISAPFLCEVPPFKVPCVLPAFVAALPAC